MGKKIVLVALAFFFVSCGKKVEEKDVRFLNGYWQIEKVVLADGSEKPYSGNTSYDFFEVRDNKGFRQKVMPQLDGTFQTNNLKENFSVSFSDGKPTLSYVTDFSKWKEELIELDSLHLVTKNASNLEYHYKRAEPINLTGDGKTTE